MKTNSRNRTHAAENHQFWQRLDDHYGFGFTGYPASFLERRLANFLIEQEMDSIPELQKNLLINPGLHRKLIQSFTVKYTQMFRDPDFFRTLRRKVLPYLSMFPVIKIWHAGCSTGEEVYTLAILLHELGLLSIARVYASDINTSSLEFARQGVYLFDDHSVCTEGYVKSGGRLNYKDYYTTDRDKIIFHDFLRQNIVFTTHNLISDGPIDQFHLILCRNVLIYFNNKQHQMVNQVFRDSLFDLGYLALGQLEHLHLSASDSNIVMIDKQTKIYRKINH